MVVPGATTPSKNNEATLDEGSTETTKPAMTNGGASTEAKTSNDLGDERSTCLPAIKRPTGPQDPLEHMGSTDLPHGNGHQGARVRAT